jgi:L-lysine exporter family protein LysE/ArgO
MVSVLGFTFLNPHVYIDTVLLLGTIGARFGPHRWFFALGAVAASTVWFLGLSVGARYASRLMSRPAAWKLLDVAVGTVMGIVGISLAVSLLQ